MVDLEGRKDAAQPEGGLVTRRAWANGSGSAKWGGVPGSRGLVNGNGLINGNGLVNGNGFINGNGQKSGSGLVGVHGLINGNGLVNGCQKPASDETFASRGDFGWRRAAAQKRVRLAVMVVVSAALIIMVPMLAMLLATAPERMFVDGDLSDWEGRTILSDGSDPSVPSPEVDIVRYSTAVSGNEVFFFVQVAGKILSGKGNGADVVNVFVDTDMDSSTGYSIRGMGADNRVEVWGFDGISRSCNFYKFSPGKGNADWNGWSLLGSGKASGANKGLEFCVWKSGFGNLAAHGYRALFQMMDTHSRSSDFSRMMAGPTGGALLIVQEPVDNPALAINSESQPVLRLVLDAQGDDLRLRELVLTRSGNASSGDIGEVQLRSGNRVLSSGRFLGDTLTLKPDLPIAVGKSENIDVCVKITDGATRGAVFGVGLAGQDSVKTVRGTATIEGFGLRSYYIGTTPARITIDGAFGDWSQVTAHPDTAGDIPNSCIDIIEGRAAKDHGSLSFLARVDGTMLGGESIPPPFAERPVPAPAGPPGPSDGVMAQPVQVLRDTVTAFIDADNSKLTGFDVNGTDVGAEYSLVVTGIAGRIQSREAFSWSQLSKSWVRIGTFEAARDPDRMELQAPLSALGMTLGPVFKAQVFASDWSGRQDSLDASIEMTDPLQLAKDSAIYSSTDGVSWKSETTIDNTLTWRDMCTDSSGNVYALTILGLVYKSTGDWTSWTKIINSDLTKAGAIATDGTNFYALVSNGTIYKTTSGGSWAMQGNPGAASDYEDMCIDSSGNLYALRGDICATVFKSTDGGQNWGAFGDKNVGGDNVDVANRALVHGPGWNSTNYIFILQSDGRVRYDTDGKSIDPWNSTAACENITGQTLMDIDLDTANKEIWTVALSGKVYTFKFNATAPDGVWNTALGSSNDSSVWAIAVNLIPEFKDLALPLGGMIAIIVLVRSRRQKTRFP